ncbi:metalloregulator ArsR/SmtB family transcription factor [Marinobacter halodurans]|uniref:Metalloregulator ArsR/SmtB family transcription factor n=1 Tax=Marinobacter halodurans TaxID=2528979 RepID=A0ABY1ZFE5_9GAMM|nr:metalloregulator ArsR/SmtB family transcription factor [Marinobacter halodurans]TBW48984.1 metalloregulator ArsR/SmtB family transcription factor [Marinobacter halodurans]
MSARRRVLFVCTANSARSLMAEAILKHMAGDQFEVASAGTDPKQPHPLALQCIEDAGMDSAGLSSQSMTALGDAHWDYVITLCDKAARECRPIKSVGQTIAWDFPDPVPGNQLATFALVLKELRERIGLFVMVHQKDTPRPIHYPPAGVFKALGDENRLTTLLLIQQHEELCVCELTRALALSQPRISRYLAHLRDMALVEDERRGQWIYYRLHPALPDWILQTLKAAAAENPDIIEPLARRLVTMPNRPAKMDCA